MKKIIGLLIGVSLIIIPTISLAQTTDAQTTYTNALKQLISLLTEQLIQLEAQLAQIQTSNNSSVQPQIADQAPLASATSWTSFTPTMFNALANAPASYTGQSIEMKGEAVDFLPLGGNGGDHNYVEVIDPNAYTPQPVLLEIDNNTNYLAAVNTVQKTDLLAAYGTAEGTRSFVLSGQTIFIPILNITRLDNVGGCDAFGCLVSSDTVIFPAGATPLTTPQNSMSSSLPSSTSQ